MSDHAARMFDRALIPNQEGFRLRAQLTNGAWVTLVVHREPFGGMHYLAAAGTGARVPVRQVVGWQRA